MDVAEASSVCDDVIDAVASAVVVDRQVLKTVLTGVLSRGHVLLEDVPGTGKTLTAQSFATALGLSFKRIQFTPDLLPGDITGSHIYRENEGTFEFTEGPVFSNVVLADEINRAPPKTQAALLEAMSESQVSADGTTYQLPDPFFVIATQNPVEQEGTFALPEAQRDRFQFKLTVEIPQRNDEREILDRFDDDATLGPDAISPVLSPSDVLDLREDVRAIHVADPVKEYILDIVAAVRESTYVDVGASPRASLAFLHAGKARAAIHGREYVIPDDVNAMLEPILSHRLVLSTDAGLSELTVEDVLEDALVNVETPSELDAKAVNP